MLVVRAEMTIKTSLTIERNPAVGTRVRGQSGTWICEIRRRCRWDNCTLSAVFVQSYPRVTIPVAKIADKNRAMNMQTDTESFIPFLSLFFTILSHFSLKFR